MLRISSVWYIYVDQKRGGGWLKMLYSDFQKFVRRSGISAPLLQNVSSDEDIDIDAELISNGMQITFRVKGILVMQTTITHPPKAQYQEISVN